MGISNADIYRIAAESCRHPDTVIAVIEGRGSSLSREAVLRAAKRLRVAIPLLEAALSGFPSKPQAT